MSTHALGRRLLLLVLGALVGFGMAWPAPARGASVTLPAGHGGGRDHWGNGVRNNNVITVNSPEYLTGTQSIGNANAASPNNIINAICKKKRSCWIHQKQVNVYQRPH
jgi:hypothetical protein